MWNIRIETSGSQGTYLAKVFDNKTGLRRNATFKNWDDAKECCLVIQMRETSSAFNECYPVRAETV